MERRQAHFIARIPVVLYAESTSDVNAVHSCRVIRNGRVYLFATTGLRSLMITGRVPGQLYYCNRFG